MGLPVCPLNLNEQADAIHAALGRHHAPIRCACNNGGCNDSACNELALQERVIARKANLLRKVITTKAKTPATNCRFKKGSSRGRQTFIEKSSPRRQTFITRR
jgi:hypothetical protein